MSTPTAGVFTVATTTLTFLWLLVIFTTLPVSTVDCVSRAEHLRVHVPCMCQQGCVVNHCQLS